MVEKHVCVLTHCEYCNKDFNYHYDELEDSLIQCPYCDNIGHIYSRFTNTWVLLHYMVKI